MLTVDLVSLIDILLVEFKYYSSMFDNKTWHNYSVWVVMIGIYQVLGIDETLDFSEGAKSL